MYVKILSEHGYEEAMLGISLSYNSTVERAKEIAPVLARNDGGHNKFLEFNGIIADVEGPLYWWMQFATYRIGVTSQSQSTMHTLLKRELTEEDFEGRLITRSALNEINLAIIAKDLMKAKAYLPSSFKQRRIISTNYKALRGMIRQRTGHKLWEWELFISEVKRQVQHPEFLI